MEGTQTTLSGSETMLIGLVVCIVLIPSATWPLVQHFQVMAHEGMHGAVGSLSGGKVEGIELKQSAEGKTTVIMPSGRSRGSRYPAEFSAVRQRCDLSTLS